MTTEFDHLAAAPRTVVREQHGGISVLRWGDAPTTVLLHGAGLNAHTWDETLLALDEDAVAVDLPGHGDSAWRDDGDYRATTSARALAEVLPALTDGRPTVLVGQSLGGATAIAVAAARPGLVRALVLVDVTPGLQPVDASQVRDFLAGATSFASRDEIVDRAVAAGIGSDREALGRGVLLNTRVRPDGSVVFKHHLVALPDDAPDMTSDFAELWAPLVALDVPVLLVRATHGYLSDDVVAEFQERIPTADIVEIDSGHNVQEQRPVELAAAIRNWLHDVA